jgi:hypothetical protein
MQTQSQCGKCGYEVMGSYQFLSRHLGVVQGLPGQRQWNAAYGKLSEHEQTTVLEMAINKAMLVRCDIEIASKGVVQEEATDFYHKGEHVKTVTKSIPNPAIATKQVLSKINTALGMSINISERDKDDKKAKLKQFGDIENSNSPMANFMKVLGKAKITDPVKN